MPTIFPDRIHGCIFDAEKETRTVFTGNQARQARRSSTLQLVTQWRRAFGRTQRIAMYGGNVETVGVMKSVRTANGQLMKSASSAQRLRASR